MTEPRTSPLTSTLTWLGLLALTLANTLIAFVNLGPFSTVIAIVLTVVMAGLITAFWMHALQESKVIWIVIAGSVIWFLILVSGTLNDYITRGALPFQIGR